MHYFQFIIDDVGIASPKFPRLGQLISEYGIDPALAFYMIRESIRVQVSNIERPAPVESEMIVDTLPVHWFEHGVIRELLSNIDDIKPSLMLGNDFYLTFWLLSISDLPIDLATANEQHLKKIAEVEDEIKRLQTKKTDSASEMIAKFQIDLNNLSLQSKTLEADVNARNSEFIALKQYSESWVELNHPPLLVAISFLQNCLYPRAKLSPIEASFSAGFLIALHSLRLPNISLISIFSMVRIFN